MKDDKYIVKSRYEYMSDEGTVWTNWFVLNGACMSKEQAEEFIKAHKKAYGDIDRKTKLKHEYMIVSTDDVEKERAEQQEEIIKNQLRNKIYFESDEWKDLKHKKYVARKERKAKQAEYLEIYDKKTDSIIKNPHLC